MVTASPTPEGEIFGAHLRKLREKRNLSQNALADAAGLTRAYISQLENGLAVPSLTTVLRLAVSLNCKVTALVSVFDKTDLPAILPK